MLDFIQALALGVLVLVLGGCCCSQSDWTSFEVECGGTVEAERSNITKLVRDAVEGHEFVDMSWMASADSSIFLYLSESVGNQGLEQPVGKGVRGVECIAWETENQSVMLVVGFSHNGPGGCYFNYYDSHGLYDVVRRNLLNALSSQYSGRLAVIEMANAGFGETPRP